MSLLGLRVLGLGCLLASALAGARTPPTSLEPYFRGERVFQPTLAPDGAHLAYAAAEDRGVTLFVRSVDQPSMLVDAAHLAQPPTFIGWADAATLVYAARDPQGDDVVHAFTLGGEKDRVLLDARAIPEPTPGASPVTAAVGPVARELRVLGFQPDADSRLLVTLGLSGGVVRTDLIRVDWRAGTWSRTASERVGGRLLFDWNGLPRVHETARRVAVSTQPATMGGHSDFGGGSMMTDNASGAVASGYVPNPDPTAGLGSAFSASIDRPPDSDRAAQRFEYRPATAEARWEPLERRVRGSPPWRFRHTDDDFYREHAVPLAFDGDPNLLYVAANVGRDTYALYRVDLTTGSRTPIAENAGFDLAGPDDAFAPTMLVFDRQHRLAGVREAGFVPTERFLAPALERVRREVVAHFPGRDVRLLEWDDRQARFLVLVASAGDLGRYFIYDTAAPTRFMEVLRRADLPAAIMARSVPFDFTGAGGVRLTGVLTLPRSTSVPPPLVIQCRDIPAPRFAATDYDPPAQALASLGYLVMVVNHRGTAGLGAKHRDAVTAGLDRVPLEDIRAACAYVMREHPFDRTRVALLGAGFGGYLAVRALELYPGEFRCAVSLDGPMDLVRWLGPETVGRDGQPTPMPYPSEPMARRLAFFDGSNRKLRAVSVLGDVERLVGPVMIVETNWGQPSPTRLAPPPTGGDALRDRLSRLGRPVIYATRSSRSTAGTFRTPSALFARIGDFLEENLGPAQGGRSTR